MSESDTMRVFSAIWEGTVKSVPSRSNADAEESFRSGGGKPVTPSGDAEPKTEKTKVSKAMSNEVNKEVKNETANESAEVKVEATKPAGELSREELEQLLKSKSSKAKVELPETEAEDDGFMAFRRRINSSTIERAEARDAKPTNPVRKNEIVVDDECSGGMKDFKLYFYEGLIKAPEGLEKVSWRVNGFVQRDGENAKDKVLCARQFVVTVKIKGDWWELPRFLATPKGGKFALSAGQTLKGARTLAAQLNWVWIKGGDATLLKKGGKK